MSNTVTTVMRALVVKDILDRNMSDEIERAVCYYVDGWTDEAVLEWLEDVETP